MLTQTFLNQQLIHKLRPWSVLLLKRPTVLAANGVSLYICPAASSFRQQMVLIGGLISTLCWAGLVDMCWSGFDVFRSLDLRSILQPCAM
jgi:hypothetical protein